MYTSGWNACKVGIQVNHAVQQLRSGRANQTKRLTRSAILLLAVGGYSTYRVWFGCRLPYFWLLLLVPAYLLTILSCLVGTSLSQRVALSHGASWSRMGWIRSCLVSLGYTDVEYIVVYSRTLHTFPPKNYIFTYCGLHFKRPATEIVAQEC